MNVARMTTLSLVALSLLAIGCSRKIDVTVANHSDVSRKIQMSTPDQTMNVGTVSPGGRMRTTLTVKESDLPADCYISAEGAARQTFTVTEDSPSKWWFHITREGLLTGPYGKDDVHAEIEQTTDITLPLGSRTVVR